MHEVGSVDIIQPEPECSCVQVDSSSLLCDCNLRWFAQWVNSSAVRGVAASCAHPEALKDRAVTSVAAEMFTCEDFPKPYILVEPRSQIALRGKVSSYNLSQLLCHPTSPRTWPCTAARPAPRPPP